MPSRNRDTLKYFFSDGSMPSSDMFADLIDSMLNMDDEGFNKSDANGFEITNQGESESLISFYKQSRPDEPIWQIRFDSSENNLIISKLASDGREPSNQEDAEKARYLLNLSAANEQLAVGIGLARPDDVLHVAGNVRSEGRRGVVDKSHPPPLPDGGWHPVAGPFTGCQALEVVARAKNDNKKYYAMVHAVALHTIGPVRKDFFSIFGLKNRIRYTHSFYDSFRHKLKLRWKPGAERGQYMLEIRTNCEYGEEGEIDFHISNLWSDQDRILQNSISSDL